MNKLTALFLLIGIGVSGAVIGVRTPAPQTVSFEKIELPIRVHRIHTIPAEEITRRPNA